MKNLLPILIFLFTYNVFSQQLECCKTINEVQKAIDGDWKLKGDSENVVYNFSFSENMGFIEVLEELNLPPKAENTAIKQMVVEDDTLVEIKLLNGIFYIELTYKYGSVTDEILELNENTFIYGKGESQHVFIRDKS